MTLSPRTFVALALIPGFLGAILLTPTSSLAGGAKVAGPYAVQITELHATAKLLKEAKHDYKGHRAQAVHQIHLALHILHPTVYKRPQPPTTTTPVQPPLAGNTEPQSVSDALLRQALEQLKVVRGQLASAPPQALAAVRSAIDQLEVALTIK